MDDNNDEYETPQQHRPRLILGLPPPRVLGGGGWGGSLKSVDDDGGAGGLELDFHRRKSNEFL